MKASTTSVLSVPKPINTENELSFQLNLRVYGKQENERESHSYLIDDMNTGTSAVIGRLTINIRKVTLAQLRPMIEYQRRNGMDHRSIMFQEALFIMNRLPNYFGRPSSDRLKYRFGFLHKTNKQEGLKLVPEEDEEKAISEIIGTVDFFSYDLAIVPLTQIPP